MVKLLKKVKEFKLFYLICVICCSLIVFYPFLFHYIDGDDTIFHIINVDIYSKISIFDKIIPMYANNLGWGVGIFYPGFPHLFASVILRVVRFFGFGVILAIKIEKLLIIFLSGFFMFLLTSKIYNGKEKGLIGGVLYITSSYFFVDIFMRDALNESMIFVAIPLIFFGLYYLLIGNNTEYFYIYFISGYTLAIYSHLLLTMWFTIVLLFFLVFYIRKILKKDIFKALVISTIIVISLTGTFVFPLLEHMIVGKWFIPAYKLAWTLPIKGYIVSDYYRTSNNGLLFINFSQITIILALIGIINLIFKKKYKYDKRLLSAILLFSAISIFLSSQLWFWKLIPSFFNTIQFAWRIVTFATFGIILFACSGLDTLYNFFKDKYRYILTLFIIIISFIFYFYNVEKINFISEVIYNNDYTEVFSTKDYFPIKSMHHIDEIKEYDTNNIKILEGTANYKVVKNRVPMMKFKISNIDEKIKIELPRFYYLGYKITDSNGRIIPYKESKIGLIEVTITKAGMYELKYVNTTFYKIAIILKTCIIVMLIYKFIKYRKIIVNYLIEKKWYTSIKETIIRSGCK